MLRNAAFSPARLTLIFCVISAGRPIAVGALVYGTSHTFHFLDFLCSSRSQAACAGMPKCGFPPQEFLTRHTVA